MLRRLRSLGRGTKMFLVATLVPPAGLLLESTCGGGLCAACPLSGGCATAVAVSLGVIVGANMVKQALTTKTAAHGTSTNVFSKISHLLDAIRHIF
jgi:hypothetical protein